MGDFSPETYWEDKLRSDYSLTGVGYTSLGPAYNHWLYRVRERVFLREIERLGLSVPDLKILDVGSGTGFYIELWKQLGAVSVTGTDLTRTAAAKLSDRYPEYSFEQLDIGAPLHDSTARYEVVSAFDVLFHIVDDERFARALRNVSVLLQPGGYFIFSDNFVHGSAARAENQVSRPLREIERALRELSFEVVRRVPMFVLMNYPVDSDSRLRELAWKAITAPTRISNVLGYLVGAVLYPVEVKLTDRLHESPTTEIMICRKAGGR